LTQQLGQARWCQIAVKLDRSGKYVVDFDYLQTIQHAASASSGLHRQASHDP
jgi:hypothetical protein